MAPRVRRALRLWQVAKVIQTRHEREAERDIFYVNIGGWDTHNEVNDALLRNYKLVDEALRSFVAEMRALGEWENVVVQSGSEFGRTLAFNGRGTDHGWGGHAFTLGGQVAGGRVHGTYPDDLRLSSDTMYPGSSGRVIPTSAWEFLWRPLAEWLGVAPEHMGEILPNMANFDPAAFFTKEALFAAAAFANATSAA